MIAGRKKCEYGNGISHFRSTAIKFSPGVEDTKDFLSIPLRPRFSVGVGVASWGHLAMSANIPGCHRGVLTSSEQRLGTLLDVLRCTGQTPNNKNGPVQTSVVWRLRASCERAPGAASVGLLRAETPTPSPSPPGPGKGQLPSPPRVTRVQGEVLGGQVFNVDTFENLPSLPTVLGAFLQDTGFLKLRNLPLQLGSGQPGHTHPGKRGREECQGELSPGTKWTRSQACQAASPWASHATSLCLTLPLSREANAHPPGSWREFSGIACRKRSPPRAWPVSAR